MMTVSAIVFARDFNFYAAQFTPYVSGFDHMKETYTDLNPIHDQFIVRMLNGEITAEQV